MSKKDKSIRVKLITNPAAGIASDSADNLKLVVGYLKKNGLKADVARAKPKAKATPLARQAIKDGYKIVIAMGGDGTVEAVMRGMIGSKVRLGIIPAGIENNIANSLGIPLDMIEACAMIASDTTRKLGVGQVKIGKGKWFYFFEMASVGLSKAMYPDGNKAFGEELPGTQDVTAIPVQPEAMPKVFLNLDDERIIAVESMLVVVSNTPVFGKKFLVAPNGTLQDGFLDISVYQDFSKTDLSEYYAKMMDGGYSGNGKVERYQALRLKVKSSPKLKVMADGIELGKGTATIKMRPGALRVIAPMKDQGVADPVKDESALVPEKAEGIPVPALETVENEPLPVPPTVKKTNPRKSVISTK
jgi:diacylglycerol kinase (ATP)